MRREEPRIDISTDRAVSSPPPSAAACLAFSALKRKREEKKESIVRTHVEAGLLVLLLCTFLPLLPPFKSLCVYLSRIYWHWKDLPVGGGKKNTKEIYVVVYVRSAYHCRRDKRGRRRESSGEFSTSLRMDCRRWQISKKGRLIARI